MRATGLALLLSLLTLACGGSSSSPPPAQAPVANAGPDQAVASGASVTLDGSGSADPAGIAISYQWAQTLGPPATLSSGIFASSSSLMPRPQRSPSFT